MKPYILRMEITQLSAPSWSHVNYESSSLWIVANFMQSNNFVYGRQSSPNQTNSDELKWMGKVQELYVPLHPVVVWLPWEQEGGGEEADAQRRYIFHIKNTFFTVHLML